MSNPEEHPKPYTSRELAAIAIDGPEMRGLPELCALRRDRLRATADQLERAFAPISPKERAAMRNRVYPIGYHDTLHIVEEFLERRRMS